MFRKLNKRNRILSIAIPITVITVIVIFICYYINKQPLKVNTLEYFIQGTTLEASGLPWGSEPSEAIKYFGKMDESYERYLSYMQRQIPIRQLYFKDVDLKTDGIGVFYTTEGKLKDVLYVFRFATEDESINAHQKLLNCFLEGLPDVIKFKEVDNGVLVKNQNDKLVSNPQYLWEDEVGNTLRLVNDSYSEDSPSVTISLVRRRSNKRQKAQFLSDAKEKNID